MSTTSSNGEAAATLKEDVKASIRQFIHKQFPVARSRGIGDHDSLLTQGIIDSLGVLEVVTFIESQFQLTVTDDELLSDHFESVSQIAELIRQKLGAGAATWTS